jgi:hypothetical protein
VNTPRPQDAPAEKPAEQGEKQGEWTPGFIKRLTTKLWGGQPTEKPPPSKVHLGDSGGFKYDAALGKWVMTASSQSEEDSRSNTPAAPPPDSAMSRPPQAPPSTPNMSTMSSRAASPAPNATDAAGMTPNRRSTMRKNARSRYVDTFNPEATPSAMDRSLSGSFLPQPSTFASMGAATPRIMTPGPRQQLQNTEADQQEQ